MSKAGILNGMAEAAGISKRGRPGGHPLRPEVVAHHQRQRILRGAATAIASKGYRQTSVADVVRAAAIARARFYENFSSKEDCFFVLYDQTTETALAAVADACREAEGALAERVRAGIEALIGMLAVDPTLARAYVVEGPVVGSAISGRFEAMVAGFAELLRQARAGAGVPPLADTAEETVVGGLYWLLYYALIEEKIEDEERLVSQLTEFSLIPFVGPETAHAASR